MNVVSLVPSWTETLVAAGVNVVARTRFCIHPTSLIKEIPAVCGTKDIDWSQLQKSFSDMEIDLVIFDQEENTKEMFDSCPYPKLATHVEKISDVSLALREMSEALTNEKLLELSQRWLEVEKKNYAVELNELPGVLEWLKKPSLPLDNDFKILYMIWKQPWMCVSKDTFIGSALSLLGFEKHLYQFEKKYPEIDLSTFDPKKTLLLFSSEPYPFEKKKTEISELGFPSAIVDGECFSWFGLRSLQFLESSWKFAVSSERA